MKFLKMEMQTRGAVETQSVALDRVYAFRTADEAGRSVEVITDRGDLSMPIGIPEQYFPAMLNHFENTGGGRLDLSTPDAVTEACARHLKGVDLDTAADAVADQTAPRRAARSGGPGLGRR